MKSSYRMPVLMVCVLMLLALACAQPTTTTPPPAAPTVTVPVLPTETPTLPPTEVPTLPPTAVPTTTGRMVLFENVRFVVLNGLSQSEQGQIVPPVTEGTPWDVPVQHTRFSFTGYPLSGTTHEPAIYVYPIEGFDKAAGTAANLKDLLASRPADANPMPFLPPTNTTQMFRAQLKYMDFDGGSGVRYVTQDGQGIWPINNKDMFYTFQGLTSDGKYYVSVIMPLSNNTLPASGDGADLAQLGNDYSSYITGIRTQMDAQPDDSFTPGLSALDELVRSITVK